MSARELARSAGRPTDVSLSMESGASAFFAARSLIVTDRASGQAVYQGAAGGASAATPAWLSPANILERYIESKYLQQGEGSRASGDADLRAYAAHGPGAQAGKAVVTTAPVAGAIPAATGAEQSAGQGTVEGTLLRPPVPGAPTPMLPGLGATGASVASLPAPPSPHMGGKAMLEHGPACWRLQCYRSRGVLEDGSHLRLYFLQHPVWPALAPGESLDPAETRLEKLGDTTFLARVEGPLRDAYQAVVKEASSGMHPSIHLHPYSDVSQGEDSDVLSMGGQQGPGAQVAVEGLLLMVGHKLGSTHSFFSGLPDIYRWHGMYAVAKFVEVFRNGVVVFTFRLRSLQAQGGLGAILAAAPSLPLSGGGSTPQFAAMLKKQASVRIGSGTTVSEGTTSSTSGGPDMSSPPRLGAAMSPGTGGGTDGAAWTPISPALGPTWGSAHHPQISSLPPLSEGTPSKASPAQGAGAGAGAPPDAPAQPEPEYVRILRERRLVKLKETSMGSEERQKELARDVGLQYVLPRTSLSPLLTQGLLSAQETSYAYSAWKFAYHFLSRSSAEFSELAGLVKGTIGASGLSGADRTSALALIARLRKTLQSAAFTEAAILDCIYRQVHVIAWLFDDFCAFNKPRSYVTTAGHPVYTPNPVSAALVKATGGSKSTEGEESKTQGGGKTHQPAAFTFDDPAAAVKAAAQARLARATGGMAAHTGGPAGALSTSATPGGQAVTNQQAQVPLEAAMSTLRKMCGAAGVQAHADDVTILTAFLLFNRSVVRSNLFRSSGRTSLAFRLDPAKGFLSKADFPESPFGVFMVIGGEFRGFHVRFSDVARGGIRLVKSASAQAYGQSLSSLFEEVYTLSHTQSRKNKDLPEGGSKGIILLNLAHQDKATVAFQKYVDGLLDLIAPLPLGVSNEDATAAAQQAQQELLFLGPDENTADLMDWASAHAKVRGYGTWKAFTTGKDPAAGGMPHDFFGMTSRGVRAFELGVQKHLGLGAFSSAPGSRVTKMQTGGPDGDLGSNEILLTGDSEVYIGIVDGSGVLCDLDGLNSEELQRLARARKPVEGFNTALLGPRGFLVTVTDSDVTLPPGIAEAMGAEKVSVPFGVAFRNNAHMLPFMRAQSFVPCGGRPASVDVSNVEHFLYGQGKLPEDALLVVPKAGASKEGGATSRTPRFTFIVEGANSFLTPDARLFLDARGVCVIKDASANKGGVTASSLEVMAALALTDAEHSAHMCAAHGANVKDAVVAYRGWREGGGHGAPPMIQGVPLFYQQYVADTQDIISANAAAEFDALWKEKEMSGKPLPLLSVRTPALPSRPVPFLTCLPALSHTHVPLPLPPHHHLQDAISVKITDLSRVVRESDALWNHEGLRRAILSTAVPPSLATLLGGPEAVLARLPETYTRALFASKLASRFVYSCGLDRPGFPPEFAFWSWTQQVAQAFADAAQGIEQPLKQATHGLSKLTMGTTQ